MLSVDRSFSAHQIHPRAYPSGTPKCIWSSAMGVQHVPGSYTTLISLACTAATQ